MSLLATEEVERGRRFPQDEATNAAIAGRLLQVICSQWCSYKEACQILGISGGLMDRLKGGQGPPAYLLAMFVDDIEWILTGVGDPPPVNPYFGQYVRYNPSRKARLTNGDKVSTTDRERT